MSQVRMHTHMPEHTHTHTHMHALAHIHTCMYTCKQVCVQHAYIITGRSNRKWGLVVVRLAMETGNLGVWSMG